MIQTDTFHHFSNYSILCVYVSSHPGVVRQLNPIPGPRSIDLDVKIEYMKYGLMTHSSQVFIHIIISEFSF